MNQKYCSYCWPTKRRNHHILHLSYYVDRLLHVPSKLFSPLNGVLDDKHQERFWRFFLELLSCIRIVQFVDNPDESKLYNRSLIFFKEAKKRNLKVMAVKLFSLYLNEFKFTHSQKTYYFEGIPLTILRENATLMNDKSKCKDVLENHLLPIARGKLFTDPSHALTYGKMIGFPLVVKPHNGSLSHHVTCDIKSEQELIEAIRVAKIYAPVFIVEKYIIGSLYRASVIGRSHVFVCRKDRANIIGDGHSTVVALITQKNTQSYRGDTYTMDSTLHKIPINEVLISNLEKQGLTLTSIVPNTDKVYLQDKYVLSHGCDITNCKGITHPKNLELFLKVAEVLQSDLIGIDYICPDIRKPYTDQKTAILEVNSLPYIDMHQFPSHGDPEPIAEVVWDIVMKRLSDAQTTKTRGD